MDKKVVGILRGGKRGNYDGSIKSGGKIISHIFDNLSHKWKVVDVFVDKNDKWHFGGFPVAIDDIYKKVDVIWNNVHTEYIKMFDDKDVPCLGKKIFPELLQDKQGFYENIKNLGIKIPRYVLISAYQKDFDGPFEEFLVNKAKEVHNKFSSPWIIKTFNNDPDIGIHIAKTFPELVDGIYDCAKTGDSVLVQESIIGRNISIHLVSNFRGQDVYDFPIIEKKDGNIIKIGRFSDNDKKNIRNISKEIFNYTNAKNYLRSDFVLHPKKGIYLTHLDFSPNVEDRSCFCHSCESVGAKPHEIIDHILEVLFK